MRITRFAIVALVLSALAVSCAWGQVVETKLDNGLTVLAKEVHAAPVFTAQLWFKVGSRNEHTGITGISHILEHMLFNSSKHYKKGEISRMVRERGGIDNAATWTDFTYYWVLLSSENLDFALKTLSERLGNALLLNDEFQKERTVIISELQGRENSPGALLYTDTIAAAFVAHPYHWPTIGWLSDVENIDIEQLRDYYRSYYHPNNATLVLVGDFDSKAALESVKKHFGGKPAEKLPRPVYTVEPPQRGEKIVIVRREGTAERAILAYHIPALTDPDTYPLTVLDQVLSGGRSSRLYQALVETQLATSAWSDSERRGDPGLFMLGANALQGVRADNLEAALLEQVEKAQTTLPTGEEMQAAKNRLEAYLVFQNDSVSDQGEQLGYYNTVADWRYLETLLPKIRAVTAEDVQAVAKKYLTTDNLTVGKFVPTNGVGAAPAGPPATGPLHYRGESNLPPNPLPKREGEPVLLHGEGEPVLPSPNRARQAILPSPVRGGAGGGVARTVLPNGMVVIIQENHANPTVAIAGNVKAGSCFDPTGKSGTSALTAEMVGRGTQKRTAYDLARETEFVGASVDVSADVESASFTAKSLTKDFPLMLDILSDELRNPSFPEDQFEKARASAISALEQSKESPDDQADRAFYGSVFPPGHPYHKLMPDDARRDLTNVTREDLMEFHRRYYRPDTVVIVIVGDVKPQEAVEQVRTYFADWKTEGPAPRVDIPTIEPQAEPKSIVIPMPDKSEVAVYFGYALGVRRSDPEFYAVRIMNQILGGSGALASLLGRELREKRGLVYDVHSTFDAALGAGPWYVALGTGPANVDQATQILKSAIADFKKNGATPSEFEQARDFIIGVFPIALETNEGLARMLLNAEFYGLGMDYISNYAKIYRSVTLDQVNAAVRKYLHPDTATLVAAGSYKEKS